METENENEIVTENETLTTREFIKKIKKKESEDEGLLQAFIIKIDTTGEIMYKFAKNIKGADINLLQKAMLETDKTGHWINYFAKNIKGADTDFMLKKQKKP